jgi:inorganic pyrophosphatase
MTSLYKAHPWHGVQPGKDAPDIVNAYIEMVPIDTVKYEIDKETGHLRIDRPQKYSSQCPSLYGFIPKTYCGKRVGNFCEEALRNEGNPVAKIAGDEDPLDICVLTERPVTHGDILVRATPIGGVRMIDDNQADDKIIAVLYEDPIYGKWKSIQDCPDNLIERISHYFATYKDIPGSIKKKAFVTGIYDAKTARQVIIHAMSDYKDKFASKTE